MVHIKRAIPHYGLVMKVNYQLGIVKNILSFSPVHENTATNWAKIYIFQKASV